MYSPFVYKVSDYFFYSVKKEKKTCQLFSCGNKRRADYHAALPDCSVWNCLVYAELVKTYGATFTLVWFGEDYLYVAGLGWCTEQAVGL